jgi:FixJ family two-component response regulator
MKGASVLIVDDNVSMCKVLEKALILNGIMSKSVNNARDAINESRLGSYHVILLDIIMPDLHGLFIFEEMKKINVESKVVIISGYADKEMAIKALRMGAFDFLEKPISLDLLCYAVKRAFDARKAELEHTRTLRELTRRNQQLLEVNNALTELMKAVEVIRRTTEGRLIQQIKTLILPVLEELREDKNLERYEPLFSRLSDYIVDIESGLVTDLQTYFPFSPKELQVALMIKDGLKNQEITRRLRIAPGTVKAYRRSIRKKVGLAGTKNKLSIYLNNLRDKSS